VSAPTVAIVHDYLNQRGGAERVVLQLARIWPQAAIYTSLYRPDSTFPEFRELDVRTSAIDRLPVDGSFRALAPLLPAAFRSLGVLDHDLVISSSSGWAHGVRTAPASTHVVYCYAPARWLYKPADYFAGGRTPAYLRALTAALRRWDARAARRADAYIAIAENVRRRIRAAYAIESEVVHPPVEVERFTPRPRGERLLCIARLLPYKRVDLVVAAATRAGIGLDVVGDGPLLATLRDAAGPTVAFHGRTGDEEILELLESCRTLVLPGQEDFGIAPLEALASGKPVVAFAAGGALETLADGETAVFFHEPTTDALLAAIRRCDELATPPAALAAAARRFAPEVFRERFAAVAQRALDRSRSTVAA
jgi:glycosyltransferase involved in cell wall biosynthesis